MHIESLILRRTFPAPVTFADLRRAGLTGAMCPFWGIPWSRIKRGVGSGLVTEIRTWWHAAIKETTGATDDIYALIDGHAVRIATVDADRLWSWTGARSATPMRAAIANLIDKADEAGYWQRPHEVRYTLGG